MIEKRITKVRRDYRLPLFCIFAFCMMATLGFLTVKNLKQTFAANVSNFKAGDIMSDAVMSDYKSMNESQIQSFLKSKNSCNDTNTWVPSGGRKTDSLDMSGTMNWHIENGHFVCMADETFDGESAAHIIWAAAQDFKINPKVIIVLLQKEQGLVTDKRPRSGQYRAATGYGCPDTAACDANYYGLKNQIRNAASMFRTVLNGGWTNYPVGNNYVQYNPNKSCGGSTVYIANRATSALYRYTPYQPNASALAAGYGTGDGCGAYGNRNFWLYYTDWFGDTHGGGMSYVGLETPRYMELSRTVNRINTDSMADYDTLEEGRVLKFATKTQLPGGEWCLRTEHNTNNGINACVPISATKEIELKYEDVPKGEQEKLIASGSTKYFIRGASSSSYFGNYMIRKFPKKTTFLGVTYYITEFDATEGRYGFTADQLSSVPSFTSFENPRELILNRNVERFNFRSGATYDTLGKDRVIKFATKIAIEGHWYYRTEYNTNNKEDLIIPSNATSELPPYIPFENPREMRLTRNVERINPYTKQVYDVLGKNRVIKFATKIYIHNQWYYRTEYNTNANQNLAIPASAVGDL